MEIRNNWSSLISPVRLDNLYFSYNMAEPEVVCTDRIPSVEYDLEEEFFGDEIEIETIVENEEVHMNYICRTRSPD